ncbi:MAG: chromosomal replication initiator protein DnaA [Pseudomonadota bacterium]
MSVQEEQEDCQIFLHPSQVQTLWDQVCLKLKSELGDAVYVSWIEPLEVITYDGQCLQLAAPTRFMKDRIQTHHGEKLFTLCNQIFPGFEDYTIAVTKKGKTALKENARVDPFQQQVSSAIAEPDEEDYTSALDIRCTFENFVIGKPNELAYAASLRIAEADVPPFNPMFLYGGVGLGKTHLMHAIAWHIKKVHPKKRIIYMSAEKFMYEFVRALRFKDTVSFKERFRNVDILMIDDVQFISGKDTTQEEFFHTFNALIDNNHQVIISADKSPSDLEGMEERLRSRLGWGLVADIHPTTYELRLGILQSKAEALKVAVPANVLELLAFRITSNVRELEGALNRIVAHSTLVGRKIDIDTTHDVLRDLLRSNDRRVITIEDIQQKVCDYYNVKISDLLSTRRMQVISKPRQVAMYLSKTLTPKSLPEIGRRFGGRDHTTVMHAVKRVEEACASDREFSNDVEVLRRSLVL